MYIVILALLIWQLLMFMGCLLISWIWNKFVFAILIRYCLDLVVGRYKIDLTIVIKGNIYTIGQILIL